jgi:hypothetical protein
MLLASLEVVYILKVAVEVWWFQRGTSCAVLAAALCGEWQNRQVSVSAVTVLGPLTLRSWSLPLIPLLGGAL